MKELVHIRQAESAALSVEEKENLLLARLAAIPSLIVALSGGADSAYLAWAADEALGPGALSVTALSPSYSAHDRAIVKEFVNQRNLQHEFIETHEMENPSYRANAADRCYFCKDELFSALDELAHTRGFAAVAYGVNADDTLDFRPGHRAATEHQVLAPLLDAALSKAEIRLLSRRAGLPTWDRPASACLSSRLPYGTEVTPERLGLVERGEAELRALNASCARSRNGSRHRGSPQSGRLHIRSPGSRGIPPGLAQRDSFAHWPAFRKVRPGNIIPCSCVAISGTAKRKFLPRNGG